MEKQPWSQFKGLGGTAERFKSKYFPAFAGIWIMVAIGLAANLLKKENQSIQPSSAGDVATRAAPEK